MKIRNDFVSNSSSSSFILEGETILDYFKITKKDIINTIKKLGVSTDEFWVYDLEDPKDKEEAIKEWGETLNEFDCNTTVKDPETGELYVDKLIVSEYHSMMDSLERIYNINNFSGGRFWDDEPPTRWIKKGGKTIDIPLEKYIIDTIKDTRERCGILTNLDILKSEYSKWFIHFSDNAIWNIKGSTTYGKNEELVRSKDSELTQRDKEIIDEIKNSKFDSEAYSLERIMEILLNEWISSGKVKIDDQNFIAWNFIASGDPDKKTYDYNDLTDNILTCCLHEG